MGVSGLNPFLQKVCPQVFKSIPNRFQEFSGKRVVLDATLITQRLHFAQVPHPYRHVLGWYRIIQELKESSVTAICIFDGKGRNAAKQRENVGAKHVELLPLEALWKDKDLRDCKAVLGELRAATEEPFSPLPSASLLVNEGGIDIAGESRTNPQETLSAMSLVLPSIDEIGPTVPPTVIPVDFQPSSSVGPVTIGEQGTGSQESSSATPLASSPANETEPVVPSNLPIVESSTSLPTDRPNPDITGERRTNYEAASPASPHIPLLPAEVTPAVLQGPPSVDEAKIPTIRDTQLASENISPTEPTIPSPAGESKQAERGELSTDSQEVSRNYPPSSPSTLQESSVVSSEDSNPYTSYDTEISDDRERVIAVINEIMGSMDFDEGDPSPTPTDQPTLLSVDDIRSSLANLYAEFKESSGELTVIRRADMSPPSMLNDESADSQVCNTVSKAQLVLTNAEEDFWKHLRERDSASSYTLEAAAFSLLQQSSMLSESYERRTQPPTSANYEECKEILRAMGVPCIDVDGPYEAEAVAASIVMEGQADYVASEDTDVLVYGAPLVRNISVKTEPLVVVSGTDVWDKLQLNQTQFIDFALLLGTDFCERIKMIGPMRALKFIREYGSIERIIESETKYSPPRSTLSYLEQVSVARLVFSTLPPVPTEDLTSLPSDELAIQAIMHKYRLWNALSDEHPWATGLSLEGNYFDEGPTIY